MTQSIDQALVTQFSDMVHHDAQQMEFLAKGAVKEKLVRGNEFTYERLGTTSPIEITGRHQATQAQDVAHQRRGAKMRDFRLTLYLDQRDELEVLIDPESSYSQTIAYSMNVQKDRLCMEAALGDVLTGRKLDTTLTASADGVETIASGSTGLTYAKLLEVRQRFIDAGVIGMNPADRVYMAITGSQYQDVMQEEELISTDFSDGKPVNSGIIRTAAGVDLIQYPANVKDQESVIGKTGNDRHCIAWANSAVESGICLGMTKDISLKINERPDLNNAKQIQATFYGEALRTEGVRVLQVDCQES